MYIVVGGSYLQITLDFIFWKQQDVHSVWATFKNSIFLKKPDFLIMQQNSLKNKQKENCKQISDLVNV